MRPCLFALAGLLPAVLLPAGPAAAAPDQAVGRQVEVRPEDLPEPYATQSVSNGPRTIARPADAGLTVPDGFTATLFAEGLAHPRSFEILPNGDVLVAEPRPGRLTLLRDADGDGRADARATFADGFTLPYGVVLQGTTLYVSDGRAVWRLPYAEGAMQAAGPAEQVTPDGSLGRTGGHWSRTLAFDPSGERFFVGIGSAGNIAVEPEPRATIQVFDADGANQRTFAAGLRNPIGLAFHPDSGALFTVVNERDGLGDHLVPDYLTHVEEGAFYGWPYAYIGSRPQPGYADRRPDLVDATVVPDLLFESHSAPIDLVFYQADMFPDAYRGDAFVTLRGSWNRSDPTGYKVVRVPFEDGRPAGGYETFAIGFWARGGATGERARVWGRPTGIAVAADGSLLIADDTGGTIWRIAYADD